ncbi:uncharacterized protein ofcc1 [Callorhinchus milii]|uniref:uncharacterized protein ofcc1 n=1 Tax=Callorhinchus milii TaxID=7868 RepID=UPI001C3F64DE|nr:uncharacterized protein ofcc1 [Callorhinchus milii]
MVLIFELFLLQGSNIHIDRVVGWGAFPICNAHFEILEGKFKCPFLRGHRDSKIDEFKKIEGLISSDLDHWLCNLYFQIIKLPKYLHGQNEYEVALQLPAHFLRSSECFYTSEKDETDRNIFDINSCPKTARTQKSDGKDLNPQSRSRCSSIAEEVQGMCGIAAECEGKFDEQIPVNGESGMYYKVVQCDPLEYNNQRKSHQHTPAEETKSIPQAPSYLEELHQHRFSVASDSFPETALKDHRRVNVRCRFVGWMFLEELGLSQWHSSEFWLIMLLIALIWFVRLYLHYYSQYLFLQAIGVPVNKFQFYPHTVELSYQNSLLHTREELTVVVMGPLTLNVAMLIMVMIRWVCRVLFGSFPCFLSKFIMAMGLWTMLDPLAIFIVDGILGRLSYSAESPIADVAKLYWLFYRTEHSGIAGILITVFLYIVLFICSLTILYIYYLRLHNDGPLLDFFHRLLSSEDHFLVPLDLEVSNQELSYIAKKAEQWRGINGERRKVAVYDYIWNDEPTTHSLCRCGPQEHNQTSGSESGLGEITTHVSIYIIHLSGLRELHRHFLRLPDGAIIEVFGDISSTSFAQNEVNTVSQKQMNYMENVQQSSALCALRERQRKRNTEVYSQMGSNTKQ